MEYTPYIIPLLFTAAFLSSLAIYSWRFRGVSGAFPFGNVIFFYALWALLYSLDLSSSSLTSKVFWNGFRYPVVASLPVLCFLMAIDYTRQSHLLNPARKLLLWVIPFITAILALTSEYQSFFQYNFQLDNSGPIPLLQFSIGPWDWVNLIYSNGLLAAAFIILIQSLDRSKSLYFRQTILLIIGIMLPLLLDSLFNFGITPIHGINLGPFILLLSGLLFSWALFQYHMFGIVPMARGILMGHMHDIMLVLDKEDRLLDFNSFSKNIIGLEESRDIGKPAEMVLGKWFGLFQSYPVMKSVKEEVSLGQGADLQFYDLSISPILDNHNQYQGRLILLHDISKLKNTEIALRESEARYRLLFQRSPVGVFHFDRQFNITDFNNRSVEILKTTSDKISGFNIKNLNNQSFLSVFNRILEGHEGFYEGPYFPCNNSPEIYISLRTAPLYNSQEEVDGGVAIIEDITERKKVENTLRELNSQLEAYSRTVAHDLRSPLTSIVTYLEYILIKHSGKLDEDVAIYLQNSLEASGKMNSLIDNLLTYSRLTHDKLLLETVDLGMVIEDAFIHYGILIQETEAQITVESTLPQVKGHTFALTQVITNLIGNSLKFVAPGIKPQILIWTETKHQRVRLWIKDNGLGIAPQDQERIFTPFHRLHDHKKYSGLGLGLAIVQKAVDGMGGKVGVESELGQGCKFWIELPLANGDK